MSSSNDKSSADEKTAVGGELSSPRIADIRSRINELDGELLKLLAERRGLSRAMAEAKEEGSHPIRDRKREEMLLVDRIRRGRRVGLDANFVTSVFHAVIEDSVRVQQEVLQRRANPEEGKPSVVRIAIQGVEGSYSHLAARKFFSQQGVDIVLIENDTFEGVAEAVEKGQADYGMLPVENTTSGGINPVYDVLLHARVSIVGEEKFKVEHCLAAKPGVELSDIREVYSHPQAVAQCTRFLSQLPRAKVEYYKDTAAAVKMVAESSRNDIAAIASEQAARLYGLQVLARDIASQKENYTRFLIAARNPRRVDPRIPSKTSLVMATGQQAGALLQALTIFRDHGLNLTKLESRPILGNPWEEMFYVDFEGNIADARVEKALDHLSRITRFMKVLGSYPSQELPPTELSSEARLASRDEEQPDETPLSVAPHPHVSIEDAEARGFRRASRAYKSEDTIVDVRGVHFGGEEFVVIAGPAFIRSREQIEACALAARERGAHLLRAGARYLPAEGENPEEPNVDAIDVLAETGRRLSIPVLTNVSSAEEVKRVSERSDMLMISARNMMNRSLLVEVGRSHRPVLLKRGWMSSIDELLQSAEVILNEGNQQVVLCERGIRTFETATRNTLDLTAIPLLQSLTHLPVIVDPSRAAGRADLVLPLALAARAAGADGVMLEVDTEQDGDVEAGMAQALSFEQFEQLMRELVR